MDQHRNNVAVKTRPAQQPAIIEEDETDELDNGPVSQPRETVSKYEAVRQALQAGVVKPQKIAEWIKAHHGYELTPGHCSSYKSKIGAENQPKAAKTSFHGNGELFAKAASVRNDPLSSSDGDSIISGMKTLAKLVQAHGVGGVQEMLQTISMVAGSSNR